MSRFSQTSARRFCLASGLSLAMLLAVAATRGDDSPPADSKDAPAKKAPVARPAIKPLIRLNIRPVAPATGKAAAPAVATPAEPAPPDSSEATHEQVKVIKCVDGLPGWTLSCFATTKDGKIVAVVAAPNAASRPWGQAAPDKSKDDAADKKAIAEARLMDADGAVISKWPLDFLAQAVNVGPDGLIYLAGDGWVARYDMDGKQLAKSESPQVAASKQDPAALERRAREQLEQQQNSMQELVKNLEAQKTELDGKSDDELTDEEKTTKKTIDRMIEVYKKQADRVKPQAITDAQVQQTMQQLASQERRTNALAVNDKYVFATGPASKGYGYRVWRTDLNFANPVAIVDGLSGCCGQMDIQCCGDEVIVAENSRHRVVRYNADGKMIASFGKRSRDGVGDCFGGCCNPMNTRAAGDKLYVAESDGQVKLFTLDGRYEGLVAVAQVRAGCKSSTVAVSPDERRVYYIDVNQSAICVLDRKPAAAKSDDKQAAKPVESPKS